MLHLIFITLAAIVWGTLQFCMLKTPSLQNLNSFYVSYLMEASITFFIYLSIGILIYGLTHFEPLIAFLYYPLLLTAISGTLVGPMLGFLFRRKRSSNS